MNKQYLKQILLINKTLFIIAGLSYTSYGSYNNSDGAQKTISNPFSQFSFLEQTRHSVGFNPFFPGYSLDIIDLPPLLPSKSQYLMPATGPTPPFNSYLPQQSGPSFSNSSSFNVLADKSIPQYSSNIITKRPPLLPSPPQVSRHDLERSKLNVEIGQCKERFFLLREIVEELERKPELLQHGSKTKMTSELLKQRQSQRNARKQKFVPLLPLPAQSSQEGALKEDLRYWQGQCTYLEGQKAHLTRLLELLRMPESNLKGFCRELKTENSRLKDRNRDLFVTRGNLQRKLSELRGLEKENPGQDIAVSCPEDNEDLEPITEEKLFWMSKNELVDCYQTLKAENSLLDKKNERCSNEVRKLTEKIVALEKTRK